MMAGYREIVGFRARIMDAMTGTELGMIDGDGDKASDWVTGRLEEAALRVYRSFDLRSTRDAGGDCTCPDHGTDACDCQMVVLLIYRGQGAPATVVLYGHQGRTWMVLADAPDAELATMIEDALVSTRPSPHSLRPTLAGKWASGEEKKGDG